MFGIDATGTHNAAQLSAAGVKFVARYLSQDPAKNLTHAELQGLRAAGINIVTVWETQANRALQAFPAGAADAKAAQAQLSALGAPRNAPVFFAVDFDATPGDQTLINAYFRGAASVLGLKRVGVYGGYWPLKRLFDAGLVKFGWQTYAWSGGNWDKRAQLRQYKNSQTLAGLSVDFDMAMVANYGQWFPPTLPVPKPLPVSHRSNYLIEITNLQGDVLQRATARYPALWLVKYNIAANKPAGVVLTRIDPGS